MRRRIPWGILPLLWLAFALGAHGLNADVLWFDEAKTVLYTGGGPFGPLSLAQVWDNLATVDPWQSPAYFLALNLWASLAGWSDFAARALSLLTGIVALAGLARLARDLFGQRTSFYATLVLASAPLYLHYLHEMRPYAQYALFTTLAVWAYWRWALAPAPRAWHGVLLWVGLAGLAWTHVLSLLTAFGLGAYHLLFVRKDRRWVQTVAIMAASAVSFLPWLGYILRVVGLAEADTARQAVALIGWPVLEQTLMAFSGGGAGLGLALLGLAGLARRPHARLIWTWLIVALASALTLSIIVPAFIHVRYVMSAWPALALLAGLGLATLAHERRALAWVLAGVWLATGLYAARDTRWFEQLANSRQNFARAGWLALVDEVAAHSRPGDGLILHSAPPEEEWSTDDTHNTYFHQVAAEVAHMERIRPIVYEASEAEYMALVEAVVAEMPLVWTAIVPEVPFTRRRDSFFRQLGQTHDACGVVYDEGDMWLALYARRAEREPVAVFDERISLTPLWPVPGETSAGQLDILLGWNMHDVPSDTYSIGLHLIDPSQSLVAQADFGLPGGATACTRAVLNVADLPPGEYELHALIYDWRTGERLPAQDEADNFLLARISQP